MDHLERVGQNLLRKPVSRINLDKGVYEAVGNGETNETALKR